MCVRSVLNLLRNYETQNADICETRVENARVIDHTTSSGFESRQGKEIITSSGTSRLFPAPTQPPVQ
jgi:hypothetical protein